MQLERGFMVLERGYFATHCRVHAVRQEYVVRAILLDGKCQYCCRFSSWEMFRGERELLTIKRRDMLNAGGGSAYDQKRQKWVTLYDDEIQEVPLPELLVAMSVNYDVLLTEAPLGNDEMPLWLNPTGASQMRKIVVHVELCVSQFVELADFQAYLHYLRATRGSTAPVLETIEQRKTDLHGILISPRARLPVEWSDESFGVLEITTLDKGSGTAVLYVCGNGDIPIIGSKLLRRSGWSGPEGEFSNVVQIGVVTRLE